MEEQVSYLEKREKCSALNLCWFIYNFAKMTNCVAQNCTNCSGNKECLSFHRVSKKAEIREKWLHNLQRQNIPENIFICDA